MNGIAAQLRDIHGLDAIPAWPPAPGWWLLGLLVLLLLWLLLRLIIGMRRHPLGTWHREAYQELLRLRRQADSYSGTELARRFSELLRRIAMARGGREHVAALSGEAWLDWLSRHDPNGFDWHRHDDLLLRLPYAPQNSNRADDPALRQRLQTLIDAALPWTRRPGGQRAAL
jgi:hypothetical protein